MKLIKGNGHTFDDFEAEMAGCVNDCSQSGDVSEAVEYWIDKTGLDADESDLREFLGKFGAWEDEELEDHDANLERLLWIACCDIKEQDEFVFE